MEVYRFAHAQWLPEYQVALNYNQGENKYIYDHSLLEVHPIATEIFFCRVLSTPLGHQQSLPQSRILSAGRFSFIDPEMLTAPPSPIVK